MSSLALLVVFVVMVAVVLKVLSRKKPSGRRTTVFQGEVDAGAAAPEIAELPCEVDEEPAVPEAVEFPYLPRQVLFSAAERSFLGVLDQAVGPDYRVLGKVRVADVAMVESGLGPSVHRSAFNRIAARHFDYVVCRASDLSVVCAVELNDKSHASRRAQASDALKRGVCEAIGLPLLEVPARRAYPVSELREQFAQAVGLMPASREAADALSPQGQAIAS